MIDRDAIIAQQTAEHQAREAIPGRYDGVLIKDLARKVEMEHMAIQSWKATNDETTPTYDPEARLRFLAASSPQAAEAFGLACSQNKQVAPLDAAGRPLTQAARDPEVLADWWQPDGPYADKWPGVPCGPEGGYFGLLLFPGEGVDWFKRIATVHTPSRVERLMSRLTDPIEAMGVPRPGADDWDDDEPRKRDEVRAPMAASLWLVENVPVHRPVMRAWLGPIRGRQGAAAMMAAKGQQPRQLSGMVWSWPTGQTLPVGRKLRKGVESLAAIPALGAVLHLGGVNFVVRQTPSLINPPPDWLVSELQRLGNG